MWQCPNCQSEIHDLFRVCWNCGTDVDGRRDREFEARGPAEGSPVPVAPDDWGAIKRGAPLVVSDFDQSAALIAGDAILSLIVFGLLLAAAPFGHLWRDLRVALLVAAPPLALWRFASGLRRTPLRVEIGDELRVRYPLGASEYPLRHIQALGFETRREWLWLLVLPVPLRRRHVALLGLENDEELRFPIDSVTEAALRKVAKRARQRGRVTSK